MKRYILFQTNGRNTYYDSSYKDETLVQRSIKSRFEGDVASYIAHRSIVGIYELECLQIIGNSIRIDDGINIVNAKMEKDRIIKSNNQIIGFDMSYMTEKERESFLDCCGQSTWFYVEAEVDES